MRVSACSMPDSLCGALKAFQNLYDSMNAYTCLHAYSALRHQPKMNEREKESKRARERERETEGERERDRDKEEQKKKKRKRGRERENVASRTFFALIPQNLRVSKMENPNAPGEA